MDNENKSPFSEEDFIDSLIIDSLINDSLINEEGTGSAGPVSDELLRSLIAGTAHEDGAVEVSDPPAPLGKRRRAARVRRRAARKQAEPDVRTALPETAAAAAAVAADGTADDSDVTVAPEYSAGQDAAKKKKKKTVWIYDALIVVCLGVFLVSAFYLGRWIYENYQTKKLEGSLENAAGVSESGISENGVVVIPPIVGTTSGDDQSIPYYNLNLEELKARNNDTVGWVRVTGTNVNYPIVQTGDNDYYLTHNFERGYTRSGWIFGDYRCNFGNVASNKNLILYGHGRRDFSMFGSLEYCRRSWWLSNNDYHIIHVTTLNEETVWRVFAVYPTAVDFYYIQTDFSSDADFLDLVGQMKAKSVKDFGVEVNADDTILTLSTCTTDADRLVVNAVLIKSEARTPNSGNSAE